MLNRLADPQEQLRQDIRRALESLTDTKVLSIVQEEIWHHGNRIIDEILNEMIQTKPGTD